MVLDLRFNNMNDPDLCLALHDRNAEGGDGPRAAETIGCGAICALLFADVVRPCQQGSGDGCSRCALEHCVPDHKTVLDRGPAFDALLRGGRGWDW